jgi:DNA-binding SARP family transcriptional activator
MTRLHLSLLGGFQLRLASGTPVGLSTKKAQALLAYLAVRPGQPHPRQKLATLLWGETGDAQARQSLRQALSLLRRSVPSGRGAWLVTEGEMVSLDPRTVDVDVAAFEGHLALKSAEGLEAAVALYRGDLLDGLALREPAFEEWLGAERERLRELQREALGRLLAHQVKAGSVERAIQSASRLLALDPLDESVHRTLMRLYARQNRWGPALRQYQLCVALLQRELGVEPETATQQLYQELLQRRAPGSPISEPAPGRRPRPVRARSGARLAGSAVGTARALEPVVVGRRAELEALRIAMAEAWRGHGQVVLVRGEAGIGKSRLVDELMAHARASGGGVLVGRSYESAQILPFGPWVEAFRKGQVLEPARLAGLDAAWQAELARLFPELGEPGPAPAPGAQDYLRLFEALARLLAHLAMAQPLAVILEDLHWADEMSLRLLAFLGRRGDTWPLFLPGRLARRTSPSSRGCASASTSSRVTGVSSSCGSLLSHVATRRPSFGPWWRRVSATMPSASRSLSGS